MDDSRKYPYLNQGWLFETLRARGVLWTGNPKAWGYLLYDWNSRGMGGFSRCNRQECESTNELMTLLTTAESKVHLTSINLSPTCSFTMKSDKMWVLHWAPEALKLMNFLSENCLRLTLTCYVSLLCVSDTYS